MMTLDDARMGRAEAVFEAVVELPPDQRAAALDQHCGSDVDLRAFVERLLACDAGASAHADTHVLVRPRVGLQPPFQIGRYRVLRMLGEGGMGVVYEAEQDHPRRPVALKVMRFALPSPERMRRFQNEAEVLGYLNHPGIAQVYEAGTEEVVTPPPHEQRMRLPFVAMELVRGEPLLEFASRRNLSVRERLDLAARVCDAVGHAHQKAVIHRDLKPANILVDETGQPKILDFGVSRILQQTANDSRTPSTVTIAGQVLGTLAYMSPEQARGAAHDVDVRSDVYSLGVVLFELLAGFLPHDVAGKPLPEAARMIVDDEPTRLSTLDRALRGDPETIVHKALAREKSKRYQSAANLADDIRRFLAGEPIDARRDSKLYVLLKQIRHHRGAVAAALLLVAGLVAFAIHSGVQALRFERQAEEARLERNKAEWFATFMEETLERVKPSVALGRDTDLIRDLMDDAAQRVEMGQPRPPPELEVRLRLLIGGVYREIAKLDSARRMLEPAVELAERVHGRNSLEYADALQHHGALLNSFGRFALCLPRFETALEIRRRLLPADDPLIADSLCDTLQALQYDGRFDEALARAEEALAIRQQRLTGDHEDLAYSLFEISECYGYLGRISEGVWYAEKALAMQQRLNSADHPDLARYLEQVGRGLVYIGRPTEALPRLEAALEMHRRTRSPDQVRIGHCLNHLRECLECLGQFDEALDRAEGGLEVFRRFYGSDPPGVDRPAVAGGLFAVAWSLQCLGRPEEALPMFKESLAMRDRLEANDAQRSQSLNGLAWCLASLGRSEEALAHYQEAIDLRRRAWGADHPATRDIERGLAEVFIAQGRCEEARALLAGAWRRFSSDDASGVRRSMVRRCIEAHVKLYDACHAAEPDEGYDAEAAEWRARLAEFQASTRPMPSRRESRLKSRIHSPRENSDPP